MKYAVLLALLAPASVVCAADGLVTGPAVVSLLEQAGYSAELDEDGMGDPLILTAAAGLDYRIYFYDCTDDACEALQFRVGLDLVDGATAEMVNGFNRDYRYARSFLDEESDPFLLMDVEMTHADHAAQFATHLGVWEELLGAFTTAMGFGGGSGGESWEEERIAWPVAPQAGVQLTYDSSHASVSSSGDERMEIRSSSVTRVWVEEDGGEVLQRWTSSDTGVEVQGAPPELEPAIASAIQAFDGIVLDVRLGAEGNYLGIANLDRIQPLYLDAMRGMFQHMGSALGDLGEEGEALAEVEAGMESMLQALASPQVLENQLAELPVAYNFPAGGGLQLDREYAYQDEGASPFGGETIPMNNTMLLSTSQQVPGHYELVWTIVPEPEATWAAIAGAARQLVGDVLAGEEEAGALLEQEMEALGRDAHFSTTVTYRIDPYTGVVQNMEHVATKRFGGKEEIETSVLWLREP